MPCSRLLSAIRATSSTGSVNAYAAACCTGAAGLDQISLAMASMLDRRS